MNFDSPFPAYSSVIREIEEHANKKGKFGWNMSNDWGTEKLQYKLKKFAAGRKMVSGNVAKKFSANASAQQRFCNFISKRR